MKAKEVTSRTLLKICGIKSEPDLQSCFGLSVDFVGFNFFPDSPRYIEPKVAEILWAKVRQGLDSGPMQSVAVMVNYSIAEVQKVINDFPAIDVLQFHGEESPDYLAEVRNLFPGLILWKAVKVFAETDVAGANAYNDVSDAILFDGRAPGKGEVFAWDLLKYYNGGLPFGIAGGISPSNLVEVLKLKPQFVDVCSGAEKMPGVKDRLKIESMVETIRVMNKA